jgi:O-antigen/teichoic acid export membrane protein
MKGVSAFPLAQVKAMVMVNLLVGFLVTIAVPRLAIEKLGLTDFGLYAVILGFAGVLAFADLGLIPGLTRALAMPVAKGDMRAVNATVARVSRIVLVAWVSLTIVCATLFLMSASRADWVHLNALIIFCAANLVLTLSEVHAAVVRLSVNVVAPYVARFLYLVAYLGLTVALYYGIPNWPGIEILSYIQLLCALPYYLFLRRLAATPHRQLGVPGRDPCHETDAIWKEAWRVSSPERFNRVLQLIAGLVERPLILAMSGAALVASYDLLSRLTLVVSAVPGALSQPLLSMLSHDRARSEKDRRFTGALYVTRAVGMVTAAVGIIVATVLWLGFHERIFGVPSLLSTQLGLLVLCIAGLNVLTAPGVAVQVAEGVTWPINMKMAIEAIGVVVGAAAAFWSNDGLLFVALRNCAIGVGALVFLLITKPRAGS